MFHRPARHSRNLSIGRTITDNGDQIALRDWSHGFDGWRLDLTPSGTFEPGEAYTAEGLLTDADLLALYRVIGAALVSAGLLRPTA